jgi:hypothetical protein
MNGVAPIRFGFTTQEATGHPSLRQRTALWQDSNHLWLPCDTATVSALGGRRPQGTSPRRRFG